MCVVKHGICPVFFHMYIWQQSTEVWSDIVMSNETAVMLCNKGFMSCEEICVSRSV